MTSPAGHNLPDPQARQSVPPGSIGDLPVTVRSFRTADLATCRKLYVEGLLGGKLAENDSGLDIDDIDSAYMRTPGNHFWVAEVNPTDPGQPARVVGTIGVQHHEKDAAEIRRLRVAHDARRRGVGSKLVETALHFCQQHNYLKVTLDTFVEREGAIKLFQKFHFRHSRTRDVNGKELLYFYLDIYETERENTGKEPLSAHRTSQAMPADYSMPAETERKLYLDGIHLFNEHEFFEAHEVWEDIWHMAYGRKHEFYQGMIQCSVALEHYRRSNPRGVLSLYESYRRHFKDVPAIFMGLDVSSFLSHMHDVLAPVLNADPIPERGAIELDPALAPKIELIYDPFETGEAQLYSRPPGGSS